MEKIKIMVQAELHHVVVKVNISTFGVFTGIERSKNGGKILVYTRDYKKIVDALVHSFEQ